ncbi:hypothetical protein ACHWQZ_G003733 [Mnemiopsis leidyi]
MNPTFSAFSSIPMNSTEVIVLSDEEDLENFTLVPECVTQEMLYELKMENSPQIGMQNSAVGASDLRMTSIYSLAGKYEKDDLSYTSYVPANVSSSNFVSETTTPFHEEQSSYSRTNLPVHQEQSSYSRTNLPVHQEQSSNSRTNSAFDKKQSSVSHLQVSSVVSLADSPAVHVIGDSGSPYFTVPVNRTLKASESATEQTKLSLSTVLSLLDELNAKSATIFNAETSAECSTSPEKAAPHENCTSSQNREDPQPISRVSTDVDTSSEIFVSVSSTSTVDPQENLRKSFQPTPILKFSQLLSYKQLFDSEDETSKVIKEMVDCPICKTPLAPYLKPLSTSKRQANITQHLRTHHQVVGTKCSACKKTRVLEWNVPCLCRTCDVCQRSFPAGVSFQRHLKSAHIRLQDENPSDFFQCILSSSCSFASESIPVFAKHLADEHSVVTHKDVDPRNSIVKCPLCSFKRHAAKSLKGHIVRFHFNGSGKRLRDKKHKSLSSSIFMFSGSYDRPQSSSISVTDNICVDSSMQ